MRCGPRASRACSTNWDLPSRITAISRYRRSSPDGPPPANAKFYDEVKTWIRLLSERAFQLARSGAVPIFMGGDHSLSMGSVNGVARYWQEQGRPLFVLWLDAHADYNTPDTTDHRQHARHVVGVPVRRRRA